jgi:hypothetical protein
LYYDSWFGDSTTMMHVSVYELDQPLQRNVPYYTNIDVKPYIQQARTLGKIPSRPVICYSTDSMKRLDSYRTVVKVPIDVNLAIVSSGIPVIRSKRLSFKTPEAFSQYFNGLYVDCDFGNGSITYVNHTELELCYGTTLESSTMEGLRDSFVLGASYFPITKEVRQVNRFSHPDLRTLRESIQSR